MTHPVHSAMGDRGDTVVISSGLGPRTISTLCGCALASTGYVLGATWLESPWLGLPLGLWLIGAGIGATHLWASRINPAAAARTQSRRRLQVPFRESFSKDNLVATLMELSGVPARSVDSARRKVIDLSTQAGLQLTPRAIRIGLDLSQRDFERLRSAGATGLVPGLAIEWVRAEAGLLTDAPRHALAFDALLRREPETRSQTSTAGGDAHLFLPEHPNQPAAWRDWSPPTELGYGTTFPSRVDAASIRLEGLDFTDPLHTRLAADLIVVATTLAAAPTRRPGGFRSALRGGALDADLARTASELAMIRLGGTLEDLVAAAKRRETSIPPAAQTAARALSAWCTTWQPQPGTPPIHHERHRLAQLAAGLLPDEAEAQLRLGAAQIAAFEDASALTSFAAAGRLLRRQNASCIADPLAFIQAEITLGEPGGLTLGRVAAGLCLLWATTPTASLAYLRDDVLDDLQHTGWLESREQDRKLLASVLQGLGQIDGDSPALRAEAA